MKYQPGEDITINLDGLEHHGEVIDHRAGWILATIITDPTWDYGTSSPRIAPHQTVCVPEHRARKNVPTSPNKKTDTV